MSIADRANRVALGLEDDGKSVAGRVVIRDHKNGPTDRCPVAQGTALPWRRHPPAVDESSCERRKASGDADLIMAVVHSEVQKKAPDNRSHRGPSEGTDTPAKEGVRGRV